MDIMIDTNIIMSAALFPNPKMNAFLEAISGGHQLFICTYSIEEIDRVLARKFPDKKKNMEIFLQKLNYALVHTPSVDILSPDIVLPDKQDWPIMASAIVADVDVLISGDRHFDSVALPRPAVMTIAEYSAEYLG